MVPIEGRKLSLLFVALVALAVVLSSRVGLLDSSNTASAVPPTGLATIVPVVNANLADVAPTAMPALLTAIPSVTSAEAPRPTIPGQTATVPPAPNHAEVQSTPTAAAALNRPEVQSTPTFTPVRTQPAAKPRDKEVVFAYYVPYDATSWVSLQAHADQIDYVAPQWVYIDACGNVGSRDDRTLVAFARSKGIRILPSLLTLDGDLNHRLLTDEASSSRAVQQIVSYVVEEGYDGLDLDLEGVNATDRQAYTAFVKKLSPALHSKGKMLTAAIPAKSFDATTGWAGAYQYSAIAPYFDLIVIMTYEYSSPNGNPGSIAPYDWVDKVVAYATSQIPPEKLLVGVAFYGYDWNVTSEERARALRYPQASALSEMFGAAINLDPTTRSATFSYVMRSGQTLPPDEKVPALNHQIATRSQPACPFTPPTPTPRTTPPKPTVTPSAEQKHVVWIEDARSVVARLSIAGRHGAAGIGTWRLGQEDPAIWSAFADWRKPSK